jgi:ABC-type branched-subunit amino acid transport system substrate-binding protein
MAAIRCLAGLVLLASLLGSSALSVPAAGARTRVAAPSQVEVAMFQPYTGADASFGPEMTAGCEPAAYLVNRAGGVLGRHLKCTAVDTRGDPADAVPAAQQLVATASNLLGVLGPSSDEALATLPIFQRSSIPAFPDSGQAQLDHSTNQYMWRVTPADDVKGYAMAVWAHLRHFKRAAAIFGNDIGSQGMVPTLQRGFTKLGGHIVINEKLALDQSSYRTEIERMLAAKPQVILSELDPQSSATFLAELQQLHGLNIPYIGTEVTLQAQWYQAVSRAIGKASVARIVTGVQYYTPTGGQAWKYYNAALKPSGQKQATWNTDPYSMSYYDSVNVMALAATAAKSIDPKKYNSFIPRVVTAARGAVTVYSFAQGKSALQHGKRIRYIGAAGPLTFNQYHNSVGQFEAARFGKNGSVVLAKALPQSVISSLTR